MSEHTDWFNIVARKKLSAPPEWCWFRIEAIKKDGEYTHDAMVTGAVPLGVKKNGDIRWPPEKLSDRVTVRDSEVSAAKVEYERETGKCAECGGKGEVLHSVSVAEGRKTKPCKKCGATGLAAPAVSPDAAENARNLAAAYPLPPASPAKEEG